MAEMSHPEHVEGSSQANVDARPVYEVGFHVVPQLDEAGAADVASKIRAQITKGGAEIIQENAPEKMRLAYTIERKNVGRHEKFDETYFGFIKFAMEREHIPALEALLKNSRDILRFLLIETVREDIMAAPRRAVFASDRLEGETIKKPVSGAEKPTEVSEEDLEKSIDALVS